MQTHTHTVQTRVPYQALLRKSLPDVSLCCGESVVNMIYGDVSYLPRLAPQFSLTNWQAPVHVPIASSLHRPVFGQAGTFFFSFLGGLSGGNTCALTHEIAYWECHSGPTICGVHPPVCLSETTAVCVHRKRSSATVRVSVMSALTEDCVYGDSFEPRNQLRGNASVF